MHERGKRGQLEPEDLEIFLNDFFVEVDHLEFHLFGQDHGDVLLDARGKQIGQSLLQLELVLFFLLVKFVFEKLIHQP